MQARVQVVAMGMCKSVLTIGRLAVMAAQGLRGLLTVIILVAVAVAVLMRITILMGQSRALSMAVLRAMDTLLLVAMVVVAQ